MILLFMAVAAAVTALAHTAPFPFVLDGLHAETVVWRMPSGEPRTIYLTFDDGPNPAATPALLDVLAAEQVPATFFLVERHVTDETADIVRRIAAEGHAIGLHSHTRGKMLMSPAELASRLSSFRGRLAAMTGQPPCRIFRPHAGWRGSSMLLGLRRIDHRMVGWGWMLWDWNFFRARSPAIAPRLVRHASPGDIVVIHDGHHVDPRADREYAVELTARLIPELRAQGFTFGRICH